ncbi:MAG: hypothetical protein K8U57_04580 [Planctomycetes bacterium]|nr:hypothetical protein [Planctomycetota bacterium]
MTEANDFRRTFLLDLLSLFTHDGLEDPDKGPPCQFAPVEHFNTKPRLALDGTAPEQHGTNTHYD